MMGPAGGGPWPRTDDGFIELVPGGGVVPQPMARPLSTAGVGRTGDDDSALLGDIPQGSGVARGRRNQWGEKPGSCQRAYARC